MAANAPSSETAAPSYAACRIAPGAVPCRSPSTSPLAAGRFGVRSPSRNGSTTTSPAGATSSRSSRSSAANRSTASVQLSVAASGRKPPAASAKPATVPVASRAGSLDVTYAVPDVPSEMTG